MLTFVVNGEVAADGSLQAAVDEALANTGRPWELRYETGVAITDLSQPVAAYSFPPDLTLRVGAGGDYVSWPDKIEWAPV